MANVLKLAVNALGKRVAQEAPEQKLDLIDDIREVCIRMENAYRHFEYEKDNDLIESAIYEIESLKARYRYLLRTAKEQNISVPFYEMAEAAKKEAVEWE